MIVDAVDAVLDFVGDMIGSLSDTIVGAIMSKISEMIGAVLLLLSELVMELVHAAYSLFSVFAGITKIKWDGEYTYLFNIFFQNSAINGIYWGMAMIGFVLLIGFSIVAVIRKIFDLGDHEQRSIGQILGSGFKGFLVIISLTAIMSAGTTLTNLLIQQVSYVFDQGATLTSENDMEFTDEQYATMARIFNTIGNYSLNPSYTHRYNLNACYNEIRPDLLYLQDQGVFEFLYPDVDANGEPNPTWQSALQKLILANDPNHALKMDPYYEGVSNALLEIITILQTDAEFYPVSHISNPHISAADVPIDRVLFISGTMSAAKNDFYNQNPGFDDSLRGAFYTGEKSIYNTVDVVEAFDIGLGGINYLLIFLSAYWVLKNLFRCLLNCTSRIVNIIGLYVVAPPLAAAMPLDGGKKFKEWTNSMIIQMVGIFGNIIPMRLVMLFLPIIMSSKLTLVDSTITNIIGKVVIVWGMLEAVGRFNGVLTSILANNGAGGAMRGIESMNRTADTRFSRYGGKFMPGTTDVDDPSGRGRKAEKQHEKDMEQQRSYQERQNSGGSSAGGNGQAANMAMKAAGVAVPGAGAAIAAAGAAGAGSSGGSNDNSKTKDTAIKAGMMAATGGASAGMTAGSFSGETGGKGGSSGTQNSSAQNTGSAEDGAGDSMPEAIQQDSEPEPMPQDEANLSVPLADMTLAEKKSAADAVFGDGGSGHIHDQEEPQKTQREAAANSQEGNNGSGVRTTGAERNAMSFAEYQERSASFGPAKQSQVEALFGSGQKSGGQKDHGDAHPDNQQKTGGLRSVPKRTAPPPRKPNQGDKRN